MHEALRWLLGIEPSPDAQGGAWSLQFESPPEGVWALVAVAGAVAAVVLVWFLYRREGRNVALLPRVVLAAVRCMILAIVAVMLLELTLIITKTELIPSHLLMLVDTSQSMSLTDPYTDESIARRTADAVGLNTDEGQPDVAALRQTGRLQLAGRVLQDTAAKLADGRIVSIYHFDSKLQPLESTASLASLAPTGADTGVGAALESALAAHRGQPLAGALLVTDGQSNVGAAPRQVALQAAKDGVPIVALATGTTEGPSNVAIVDIETSPVVFVRDPVRIAALVEAQGLADTLATVTLEQRRAGGDWEEVGSQDAPLGQDKAIDRVHFELTPESTGQYDFRATVSNVGAELTDADNVRQTSVKVIRQRIRVLVLAGYPAPEVQFLRNALLRDTALEFASWLQTAGEGYEQIGHRPLRRLPENQQELNHYDVLVLFDPDMRLLPPGWSEMLTRFVGDAGGGLVYIAGELHATQLFNPASGSLFSEGTGRIDNSWLRVLPVVRDPGLYQSSAEVQLSSLETWNLELTPAGEADAVFAFDPRPDSNREIIASLPGMYWHFPVSRAKPAATVLARHGDPRMRNNLGRHVLMATHLYGPGRTVFIGFDSTFRWRYLHEEYFDGFWARLIDRVGRSKVLGGRYPFTLATDKTAYRTGDRVTVRARFVGSGGEPPTILELTGEVELAGQPAEELVMEPAADDPEVLEGSFLAERPGEYMVRIVPSGVTDLDTELRPATLPLRVEAPRQETDNPTLNRALLEDVARTTGGRVFTLAEHDQVADAFQIKQVERILEYRDELWDAPLLFGGLVVLLTAEWLLRKRFRMA